MCFGGGSSAPAQPATSAPGGLDVSKATPDPSQAYRYRGTTPPPNDTGRAGGPLLLDAANKAALKQTTGQ